MRALLQRVTSANVTVDSHVQGEIGQGLLVFLGIEKDDDTQVTDRLLQKIIAYRIFSDESGKMNLSISEAGGGLLVISQFTLAADTRKGLRPGFSSAKAPDEAERLYEYFLQQAKRLHPEVACGVFGAHMKVALVNDGPVTFLLES